MNNSISKYIDDKNNINFEELLGDYKNYIYKIVYTNCNDAFSNFEKEEIIADIYFNIWHSQNNLLKTQNLKSYISTICKNVICDKFKELKLSKKLVELDENMDYQDDNDIITMLDSKEISNEIKKELSKMKKIDYKIFSSYYYLNKSIKEISNDLKISETSVKVKLHRIRKKIKNNLEIKNIKYLISIFIVILLFTFGFVYANDIIMFIEKLFKDSSEGVQTAINNGYVESYIDNFSEYSNGVRISIDNLVMDDLNLNLMFSLEFEDESNVVNVGFIDFPNLLVTDENNNLIITKFQSNNESKLKEVIKDKDSKHYPGINDGSESVKLSGGYNNILKTSYSTHSKNFPKSKKLIIQLDTINLYSGSSNITPLLKNINGNWKIEIDVPEKFYNRNNIVYILKENNKYDINIISANVYDTSTFIELTFKYGEDFLYFKDDPKEIIKSKLKFIDNYYDTHFDNNKLCPIKNNFILDSNGNKIMPTMVSDGDGYTYIDLYGFVHFANTYNLTKYNVTDEITLVLEKNDKYFDMSDGKYIYIKLKKQ